MKKFYYLLNIECREKNFCLYIDHGRHKAKYIRLQPHRHNPLKGTVEMLKNHYAYYHKKHYGYKKLYHSYQRKNLICNISAGKLIVSAVVAVGITLNPVVITLKQWSVSLSKRWQHSRNVTKRLRKQILQGSSTKKSLTKFDFTSGVNLSTKKRSSTD